MDNFPLFSFGKKEETEVKRAVLQALQALRDGKQASAVHCKLQGLDREIADVVNEIVVQHQACEAELDRVAKETKDGKVPRVQLEPGMWLNMAWSVDSILRSHAEQFHHCSAAIHAIANGDFSSRSMLQGAPLELQDSVSLLADNLDAFTSEVKRFANNFGWSEKCERLSVSRSSGSWKDTADSLNGLHERLTSFFEEGTAKLNSALNLSHAHNICGLKMAIDDIPDIMSRDLASERFANMGFELRTPLNGIIGLSDVLEESNLDVEQKRLVQQIKDCGRHIIELVNDFLEFDRIMNGKLKVYESPLNLRQSCENVLCELSNKFRFLVTNIDIDKQLPETLLGDNVLFMTMLRNLIAQAANYSFDNELLVTVKEQSRESDKLKVEISIQGYAAALVKVMSSDSTTMRYGPLPVALRVIKMLNGKWEAESTSTNGTKIMVTLPMKLDPNATSSEIPANLLQREMLVVCANPLTQQVLARTISGLGMLPITVGSCESAIEHLQKPREPGFVAVLVDGDDQTLKLLAEEGNKHNGSPIFVMSSNSEVEWPRAKRLEKPVGPSRLLNALRHPKRVSQAYAPSTCAPHTAQIAQISAQYATTRILFAATNAVNRKVYEKLLAKLGCPNVVIVENGAAAIKEFEKSEYDMLFLDSIEDAVETTKIVRAKYRGEISIIGVTAHVKDRELFIEAGMDDHFTKPVSLKTLADIITRILSAKTGTANKNGGDTADEGIEGEFVIVGNK